MPESPQEAAADLKDELLEILRQLNRIEMEATTDVDGLEVGELHHLLTHGAYPRMTTSEVEEAVAVLVGNRLARELSDAEYAWDRGRVVGSRYAITTEGKAFLLESLERTNRVD
jgi:hypothetical protein